MIARPKSATLPPRIDSTVLMKHRHGDEPMVVVKMVGIGATAPYEMHDTGTRSIVMRWDKALGAHTLRVPLSLWMDSKAKFAHDLMDQRRLPYPLVVLFDMSPSVAPVAVPAPVDGAPRRERSVPPVGPTEPDAVLPEAPYPVPDGPTGAQGHDDPVGTPGELPIIIEIKRLLAVGKKRVGDLAVGMRTDEDMIREAINSEGSGLQITGGWVKLLEG